jgi:hypothetical protein
MLATKMAIGYDWLSNAKKAEPNKIPSGRRRNTSETNGLKILVALPHWVEIASVNPPPRRSKGECFRLLKTIGYPFCLKSRNEIRIGERVSYGYPFVLQKIS